MTLTEQEKKDLPIKRARNGKGIFGKRDFTPQEVIFEVTGTFIRGDEEDDIEEETRNNTYRYDKEKYLSPEGRLGAMLNHSCEPNAKVVKKHKKLFIVATKDIPKGTEVVFDYSTILASDDIWRMDCNCGAKNCRGIIKKFNSLPKKTKRDYLLHAMVPKYILD